MIERVDQVLITASPGDAITSMALELRKTLRQTWPSDIFALTVLPELWFDVFGIDEMPVSTRLGAIVYHASYGEPKITDLLLKRREKLLMLYHNLTPSEFFMEQSPQLAAGVQWGRHELRLLRDRVDAVAADSSYNAAELRDEGYRDVEVLPLGLDPNRLVHHTRDDDLHGYLERRFPHGYIIVVAQQLPHKRVEIVLQAMHLVRSLHHLPVGLVIVGPERIEAYSRALHHQAHVLNLGDPWFTGSVSDRTLATMLRGATAYVSASAHEGFGVPPLEAMALCVPVIIRGAGAIPETVGDAAIVLPEDAGPCLFAEAIAEIVRNLRLRTHMSALGIRRVHEVEQIDNRGAIVEMISELA